MRTQTINQIDADVTEEMVARVKDSLAGINGALRFLIGLNPADRQGLPKIDVSNKVFVEDALAAARNNPDVLPRYMSIEAMTRDKTGYERLDELVVLTAQLAQKLRDTQILMGSEAYVSALTIYRLFESAARDGVPGADAVYRQLAERFKGQGVSDKPEDAGTEGGTGGTAGEAA